MPLFLLWPLLAYLAWRASLRHDTRPRLRLMVFLIAALAGLALVEMIRRFENLQWWQGAGLNATVYSTLTYGCLIGLPLLGYFIFSRPWGQLKLVLPTLLPGLVLMALLFVPWLVYLNTLFPSTGSVLWQQVGARGAGSDGWTFLRTPGFYLASIITFTLPWTIFLPGAVLAPLWSAPGRRLRAGEQAQPPLTADARESLDANSEYSDGLVMLLLWVFGLVLLFSAVAGKRVHYILPAVPALCLLAGYAAEDVFFRHRWFKHGMAKAIMVSHAALGVLALMVAAGASEAASKGWIADTAGAIIELLKGKVAVAQVAEVAGYLLMPLVVMALLLCAAAWAQLKNRPALSFAGLIAAVVVLLLAFGNRPALLDESPNARGWVRWIRGKVPASAKISMWDYNRNTEPLTFAIGHDMPNATLAREAMTVRHGSQEGMRLWEAWMRQDGGRWLLVSAKDVDEVKGMGYTIVDPNHTPPDEHMDVTLFQPPVASVPLSNP